MIGAYNGARDIVCQACKIANMDVDHDPPPVIPLGCTRVSQADQLTCCSTVLVVTLATQQLMHDFCIIEVESDAALAIGLAELPLAAAP